MPETSDYDLLLKAANYEGPPGSAFSQAARDAVESIATRMKAVAVLQLQIAEARIKAKDVPALAASYEERGVPLS